MVVVVFCEAEVGELVYSYTGKLSPRKGVAPPPGGELFLRNALVQGHLVGTIEVVHPAPVQGTKLIDYVWLKSAFIEEEYRGSGTLGSELHIWRQWMDWVEQQYPKIPFLTNEVYCCLRWKRVLYMNDWLRQQLPRENVRRCCPPIYPQ